MTSLSLFSAAHAANAGAARVACRKDAECASLGTHYRCVMQGEACPRGVGGVCGSSVCLRQPPPEWSTCVRAEDCEVLGHGCGEPASINRKFRDNYEAFLGPNPIDCAEPPPHTRLEATCAAQRCGLKTRSANANVGQIKQFCPRWQPAWSQCQTTTDCVAVADPCGERTWSVHRRFESEVTVCSAEAGIGVDCPEPKANKTPRLVRCAAGWCD